MRRANAGKKSRKLREVRLSPEKCREYWRGTLYNERDETGSRSSGVSPPSTCHGTGRERRGTLPLDRTLLDLANSTMSISVNGKNIYTGAAKAVQISLGGPGQTTTVGASVTSLGRTYTRTLALKPGDVSLVVEPLATAPALYLGKPLGSLGGSARLVAVADFRTTPASRIDPATLSYAWSVDGTSLIGASGVGRSSVILPSPLAYRSRSVSVVVQSRDGSLVGGDSITLTSQNPVVRVME